MQESFESKLWRWGGNLFPAYRRSGARITFVSACFHRVDIALPCNWQTKNHMRITWGGSLYAAVDPIYAVMLYRILGRQYRVIDRQADIQFIKPSRETLYGYFRLSHQQVQNIQQQLNESKRARIRLVIELVNQQGRVHMRCIKELQVDSGENHQQPGKVKLLT